MKAKKLSGVAYLWDDFASFVGCTSYLSFVFWGAHVVHPTRIIRCFSNANSCTAKRTEEAEI
ncbi:hypothetical protein [Nostoc sp.]|uniref:hypothetical protein n=1 Tax=Nostoc sp. TaxID=1180 RepID=UPI002FF578CA